MRACNRPVSAKRDATSIVEVVSAEDIGKLPDVSIAESLARLPGLAGQRVGGRAQVISIRGLAPDFTTTLLNGRQQASSGDNRAVEFDQYPSELLSSVVVYKTPDATIAGFGLSGTADLRTVRPLEFGRRAIALNVRGETTDEDQLNDEVDVWGNRVSVSYIDQFANDTIGIAIGYAHLDSPSQNRHFKAYGYESFGGVSPGAVTPDSADDALQLNGQEVFATSRENVRDAVIGIVEWAPTPDFHSTLDLYYSTFSQEETTRGAQWFSNAWADNATFTDVVESEYGGSPFGAQGTFNNAVPIIRNDYNKRDDELFAAGLNVEYNITDMISIIGDLSYSKNERDEQVLETYAGYGLGVGGVTGGTPDVGRTFDSYDFDIPTEGYPTYDFGLDYADASQVSLGDRAPWGGWAHDGAIRFPHVEETIQSGDFGVRFDFDGPISRVDVGVNLTNREKSKFVDDNDLFLRNGRQQVLVDQQYLVSPTSLGFAGMGSVLSVNLPAALDVYYTRAPILDANFYDKAWDIEEDVTTWYVRASLDSGPWRGNFGLQIVEQEQESTGSIIQGSPITPLTVTRGQSYTDILPSVNLGYEIADGHRIRFAMARVMARPRMDEMRANITPSFGLPTGPVAPGTVLTPWTASGGNPELEPWRADAFDLSYEWYIDRTSYFSVAYFYKDLESYIFNEALPFDFTGVPIPAGAVIPPGTTVSPIGTMVLPANGQGGLIRGVEVSGALDLGLFEDSLEGLGLIASYSHSISSLNPSGCTDFNPANCPATPPTVRIPGLSGDVYNITGYFERGGFQARASYRYRSAFKGEVVQLFTTRGFTEILEDEQVDAQIGYTFPEGSFAEGLGILLQVNNLTNSPYRTRLGLDTGGTTTADGAVLQETYEEYGRQILLGLNYRF
ncbi:MAG: TonB-dependent receptor [Terricaulis sp.]